MYEDNKYFRTSFRCTKVLSYEGTKVLYLASYLLYTRTRARTCTRTRTSGSICKIISEVSYLSYESSVQLRKYFRTFVRKYFRKYENMKVHVQTTEYVYTYNALHVQ